MSNAQQEASRRNGAKSVGPVTDEGKQRSARNAVKHGLTGGPVVLPNESAELYEELMLSLGRVYRASTVAEWNLIQEMAACRWRLTRIERMETAILAEAFQRLVTLPENEQLDPDTVMAKALCDVTENSKGFRQIDRHQRTLWRSYNLALKQLQELQSMDEAAHEEEEPEFEPASGSFCSSVPDYSCLAVNNPPHQSESFMKKAIELAAKQNQAMDNLPARSRAA